LHYNVLQAIFYYGNLYRTIRMQYITTSNPSCCLLSRLISYGNSLTVRVPTKAQKWLHQIYRKLQKNA